MLADSNGTTLENLAERNPGFAFTLLNEKQAAQLLGTTPGTLRTYRTRRTGPPYTKVGAAVRYERLALLKYAAQGAVSFADAKVVSA